MHSLHIGLSIKGLNDVISTSHNSTLCLLVFAQWYHTIQKYSYEFMYV